jgi:CubicO group peptidase (beta-lactamase class C family)
MQDLLPGDWKLMDAFASEKASLRDVLSHVSGLPRCVSRRDGRRKRLRRTQS